MGYQRPILLLKFADPEMAGLEVRSRRISMGDLAHFSRLADVGDPDRRDAYLDELYGRLAHRIVSWNLEDADGQRIPPTVDVLADQDKDLIMGIVNALMDTADISGPLDGTSPDGGQSLEASMPMDVSSPNPPS